MTEHDGFSIELEQVDAFEFRVRWDWPDAADVILDEPEPLGSRRGPNASRLVAAAVGNCLTASLVFCLQRMRTPIAGVRTSVRGTVGRNERGRLRLDGLAVRIALPDGVEVSGLERCLGLFEDYCVVTESIRRGVPVEVEVVSASGDTVHRSGGAG